MDQTLSYGDLMVIALNNELIAFLLPKIKQEIGNHAYYTSKFLIDVTGQCIVCKTTTKDNLTYVFTRHIGMLSANPYLLIRSFKYMSFQPFDHYSIKDYLNNPCAKLSGKRIDMGFFKNANDAKIFCNDFGFDHSFLSIFVIDEAHLFDEQPTLVNVPEVDPVENGVAKIAFKCAVFLYEHLRVTAAE